MSSAKHLFKQVVLTVALILTLSEPSLSQESHFQLSSSAFEDNGMMAVKYAGRNPANANCVGDSVSPPLAWKNLPVGTRSLAIIMYDQEGRSGLGVSHWVAYGIPSSMTSLSQGLRRTPMPSVFDALRAFLLLPMSNVDSSLPRLDYSLGIEGRRAGYATSYYYTGLGDTRFDPIWEQVNRRDTVIFAHSTDAPRCTPVRKDAPQAGGAVWEEHARSRLLRL